MDDVFQVLDCVLRSRYRAPEAIPNLPIWQRLPSELSSALASAAERREPLGTVVRLVLQVRTDLYGKPEEDSTGERAREYIALRLGLLYLAHREGQIETADLLSRAFHVADSYVCDVDPRPFIRLRNELTSTSPSTAVEELFAPYTQVAQQCVEHWGLR